jgi:flagellar biosynthetic protein FliQ
VHSAASPDYFIGVAQQALWVLALTASPILIPTLLAGVILGMIQAATSINEQTLSFVPKLILIGLCLVLFGSAMLGLMADFTRDMFARIPDVVQ